MRPAGGDRLRGQGRRRGGARAGRTAVYCIFMIIYANISYIFKHYIRRGGARAGRRGGARAGRTAISYI